MTPSSASKLKIHGDLTGVKTATSESPTVRCLALFSLEPVLVALIGFFPKELYKNHFGLVIFEQAKTKQ